MTASSSSTRNGAAFCRSHRFHVAAPAQAHAADNAASASPSIAISPPSSTAAPRPAPTAKTPGSIPTSARSISICTQRGVAHSVETRIDGGLVGGLYGVAIGGAFFGESMFSRVTDASKAALVHLAARLRYGGFKLLDAQFITPHLEQFGAQTLPRRVFQGAARRRRWRCNGDFGALPQQARKRRRESGATIADRRRLSALIRSSPPIYGTSAFGTVIEPSACW